MKALLLVMLVLLLSSCGNYKIAVVTLEYLDGTSNEIHCRYNDFKDPKPLAHYKNGITVVCGNIKVFTHLLKDTSIKIYEDSD